MQIWRKKQGCIYEDLYLAQEWKECSKTSMLSHDLEQYSITINNDHDNNG